MKSQVIINVKGTLLSIRRNGELKNVLNMFVIGKPYKEMDEMEKMIEMKSLTWAWYYQIILLLGWFIYKGIFTNEFSFWLLFIIASPAMICLIVKSVYSKKMSGGIDEK